MRWKEGIGTGIVTVVLGMGLAGCRTSSPRPSGETGLKGALVFHAPFDRSTDADFAGGDPWIYQAPALDKIREAKPGLPPGDVVAIATGEGRYGGALRYSKKSDAIVFFKGKDNVPWSATEWSGTISFWLKTDFKELAEGYTDPLQVTTRAWNDAAIFVEFEKRPAGVPFRLGAYPDFKVWNPRNRDWGTIPKPDLPLLAVEGPPFGREKWTHVAITWRSFNTGKADGVASLYLDGGLIGTLPARQQTFTWNPGEIRLMLGVGYVGWIDDVAVFRRALAPAEVQQLRALPHGIRSLMRKGK